MKKIIFSLLLLLLGASPGLAQVNSNRTRIVSGTTSRGTPIAIKVDGPYSALACGAPVAGVVTCTVTATRLYHFEAPPAASATTITAAFSGNAAPVDPTNVGTAITQPVIPRNLTATFGATWSGTNNIKVYGTDQFDAVINETFSANPGGSTTGAKAFKTVTKVTKTAQFDDTLGNALNTCSIGTGVKFGIAAVIVEIYGTGHLLGTGLDPVTIDLTYNTVSFATAPNAARSWNAIINIH